MVWGVRLPSVFNEFFPRGAFPGYREALAAHYNAEQRPGLTPRHPVEFVFRSERPVQWDGQPYTTFSDYMSDVTYKFHAEMGVPRPHKKPLLPIQPHEWPKKYVYEKIYKRPASLIQLHHGVCVVEEKLRDVIERLEPGVHQFHPIQMELPKGVEHPIRFHIIVVGRWLNSFSLAQSLPGGLQDTDTRMPVVFPETKENYAGTAMAASVIGSAHIWRERGLRGADFFISDMLKDEVTKAGLRLPPSYKMKSV
jgi:hypothetical protein